MSHWLRHAAPAGVAAETGTAMALRWLEAGPAEPEVVVASYLAADGVLAALADFGNVEVHGADRGKIVIVIEGPSTGVLGDTLMRISLLDGVIAANMVFEHVEIEGNEADGQRTDAA